MDIENVDKKHLGDDQYTDLLSRVWTKYMPQESCHISFIGGGEEEGVVLWWKLPPYTSPASRSANSNIPLL